MNTQSIWELIGYLASLLVLISLLMTSVVKLRIINLIGSFIFAIYALAIRSYPTAVMNFCLVGVNIWQLIRIRRTNKHFFLLQTPLDSPFLRHFLDFYRQDIDAYFPGFRLETAGADTAFFVCCDTEAAGLLIGRETEKGTLELSLDYSTPAFRDCSVGRFLYAQLAQQGCKKLVFRECSEKHRAYLKKMGFTPTEAGYVKHLA